MVQGYHILAYSLIRSICQLNGHIFEQKKWSHIAQRNRDKLCQMRLLSARNEVAKILVNFSTGILFKFVIL